MSEYTDWQVRRCWDSMGEEWPLVLFSLGLNESEEVGPYEVKPKFSTACPEPVIIELRRDIYETDATVVLVKHWNVGEKNEGFHVDSFWNEAGLDFLLEDVEESWTDYEDKYFNQKEV